MSLKILFLYILNISFPLSEMEPPATADKLLIESVQVLGNDKTKGKIILREMSFQIGDSLSLEQLTVQLERSRRNIFNTNLFVWCKADFDVVGDKANIIIEVRERFYLLPLPILFLADRSFNEWWYNRNHDLKRITYGVQLNHSNLSGNGDQLKLKAYGGFVPYFELSYARPYIDKRQRMGLRGGIFYSTQKSLAYRTWEDKLDFLETDVKTLQRKGAYVEYSLRNSLYHIHRIYLGFTESTLSDSVAALNTNYFGTSNGVLPYFTFKYDYRFDKVNNVQYPLEGQVFMANLVHYGLGFSKHLDHLSVGFSYQKFMPLGAKFYANVNVRGQASFPKKQLYPFISAFGLKNNLVRGYELNVIDGQHFGLLKADLKYELFNRVLDISRFLKIRQLNSVPLGIYAKVYGDMGYVKNYFPEFSQSELSNKILFGGGTGVDFVTFYSTAIKINLSLNQYGFSKLYFGVYRGI